MKKCVGYIRVSSKEQAESGESLSTQRQKIEEYAAYKKMTLVKIYEDDGFSGSTTDGRPQLKELLADAELKKFDIVVFCKLDRFGRNLLDLKVNADFLKSHGVSFVSLAEDIDVSTPQGELFFHILGAFAQFERDNIRERCLSNKIARCEKGIPAHGSKYPFARIYNKENNTWSVDETKAFWIRKVAEKYLSGVSLNEIVHEPDSMIKSADHIAKILRKHCGSKWSIEFKESQKIIVFDVPPLLDEDIIKQVIQRLGFNRTNNRHDVKTYALTGFIKCAVCGESLTGQTQYKTKDKYHQYYKHSAGKFKKCDAFGSISLPIIENAIFETIRENMCDEPSFNKAVEKNCPDDTKRKELEQTIASYKKQIKIKEGNLNRLVEAVINGTLQPDTIKQQETNLSLQKEKYIELLAEAETTLSNMPTEEEYNESADTIRSDILKYFKTKEHFSKMTYEQKQALLHFLFNGKDLGISVKKLGEGRIEYDINGSVLAGTRIVKDDNINYHDAFTTEQCEKNIQRLFEQARRCGIVAESTARIEKARKRNHLLPVEKDFRRCGFEDENEYKTKELTYNRAVSILAHIKKNRITL